MSNRSGLSSHVKVISIPALSGRPLTASERDKDCHPDEIGKLEAGGGGEAKQTSNENRMGEADTFLELNRTGIPTLQHRSFSSPFLHVDAAIVTAS